MLEHLVVKGFQKHKSITIDFDEKVTLITGDSDAGKSSLIRALRWICTNKLRSKNWLNNKSKYAEVAVTVDGVTVKRRKGQGKNAYKIDNGEPFRAVREEVPVKVSEALQITDLNFTSQHATPLWFSLTPGQVSKELNQIVNLEIIDKTLTNIASRVRKVKAEEEVTIERLREAKRKSEELSWVEEADIKLKEIEVLENIYQRKLIEVERLEKIISDGDRVVKIKKEAHYTYQALEKIVNTYSVYLEHLKRVEGLSNILLNIKEVMRSIKESKQRVIEIEKELEQKTGGVCPICKNQLKGVSI